MKGERFGRLVVVEKFNGRSALVRCGCGVEKVVQPQRLRSGKTTSCGCYRAEMLSARRRRHGMTESREYGIWCNMKDRCNNPRSHCYRYYGGRGISVCQRWSQSFETFLQDMGPCPPGGTIDRILNDQHYGPMNCRWLSMLGQQNNRRNNVVLDYQGRQQTISEWARELGLNYATLYRRIVIKGEAPEVAFRLELTPGVKPQ